MMMPELLVVDVVVQERSGRPALDPPEAQLQCSPVMTRRRKPGAVGLVERVVVEEVAVLVGQVHRRPSPFLTTVARPFAARRRRGGLHRGDGPCGVPATSASAIARWAAVDEAMMSVDLAAVDLGVEQRGELARPEQRGERLAVDLVEQRVAARPGDRRVERAVERAELVELRRSIAPRARRSRRALRRWPGARQLRHRRLDHPAHLEQLAHQRLAIVERRQSPVKLISGSRSATTGRLPRRSR